MIKVHSYYGRKVRAGKLADIRDRRKTTIGIISTPSQVEIKKLSKILDISEDNLRELLQNNLKPRVEDLEKNSAIIIHEPYLPRNIGRYRTRPIVIITSKSKNYAIIIQKSRRDIIKVIESRYQTDVRTMFSRGVSYMIYRIMDSTIRDFIDAIENFGEHVDQLETKVVKHPGSIGLNKIFETKKEMIYLHKALLANRDVAMAIETERISNLDKKMIRLFREVYEDAGQAIDLGETYREILSGTLDMYLSGQSNKLNETMKTLTIIASFAMIPTLIAGIYGMNFGASFGASVSPLNMPELRWMYGYPFALGLMAVSIISLRFWLKKKKLL